MNKRFRMLSLMSEAVELEIEDALEQDAEYEKIFRNDFSDVTSFLIEKNMEKIAAERIENQSENKSADKPSESLSVIKKIYRDLARKTHPDVSDNGEEDFRDIQRAYHENDIPALLVAANKYSISPNISESDLNFLKDLIERKRQKISDLKGSVRWRWAQSDKSREIKQRVMISMGVSLDEFHEWLSKRKLR